MHPNGSARNESRTSCAHDNVTMWNYTKHHSWPNLTQNKECRNSDQTTQRFITNRSTVNTANCSFGLKENKHCSVQTKAPLSPSDPLASATEGHLKETENGGDSAADIPVTNSITSTKFAKRWKWLLKKYRHNKTIQISGIIRGVKRSNSIVINSQTNLCKPNDSPSCGPEETRRNQCIITLEESKLSVPEETPSGVPLYWPTQERHNSDDQSSLECDLSGSRSSPYSLDGDRLSLGWNKVQSRGKSTSPIAVSGEFRRHRDQLQRGASLSLMHATRTSDQQSKINRNCPLSSSDGTDKTLEHELDGPWVKGTIERFKRTKLTGEMRDKLFHKPPNSNPSFIMQFTGSGQTNIRAMLNKLFRSHWPSLTDVERWGQSFSNILHDKAGILLFREFLRTEFSDENIEFWLSCEDFRNSSGSRKLQNKAQKIFNEFVAVQSKREVNLDSTTRNQLEKDLESVTRNTFDQSQKRIQALMEKDSYCRFLRSELYMATLEHCRELSGGQLACACHKSRPDATGKSTDPRAPMDAEHDAHSTIPGLLPNVKSPREISSLASQHQTGSFSAPSSPKQNAKNLNHPQISVMLQNQD